MSTMPDYSWQQRAVAAWSQAGRRGIIEAVTGSGKTHVAVQALAHLYGRDKTLSTLIVVPTILLLEQWYEKLSQAVRARFPQERIGRIGGGHRETFAVPPIAYIATVSSALNHVGRLFEHCWERQFPSFLIADECHHYVEAPVWSRIVQEYGWRYVMGLSATIEPYAVSGMGQIVYTYNFRDSHRDGLVPAFDIVNAAVQLTREELHRYLELTEEIRQQFHLVHDEYPELEQVPDEWLFRRLQQMMGKFGSGHEPLIERLFLLLFRRAAIYYMAQEKMRQAEQLIRLFIEHGRKIMVFFERIAAADLVDERIDRLAAARLREGVRQQMPSLWCKVSHSGMPREERAATLEEFRRQGPSALLVCRSFDEGIDIPEVDGAILVASTGSKRQRIQRIGRTLRRGEDKRPIIVTLFARGTSDGQILGEDRSDFQGVAEIHETDQRWCVKRTEALLARRPMPVVPVGGPTRDKWELLVEGNPLDPDELSGMFTRIVKKGRLVRIEYADGSAAEGVFQSAMSYELRLAGRGVSWRNIVRAYCERS